MSRATWAAIVVLPLLDLAWNLTHLNIGLADFYGLTLPALGLVHNGAWPATPYFPAGYPLLLIPFGLAGSTLVGGYILSALGGGIALTGLRQLALEFELSEGLVFWCILLAWLAPSYRVVAISPSVDALFTGLALWFIWAAIRLWRSEPPDRVVSVALITNSIALPLLRYHAVILILPVLLILLLGGRARPLVLRALAVLALTVAFNYASWGLAYHGLMPSVASIQIRNGIEADYRVHYPIPEKIYADYPAYTTAARARSIFQDYPLATVLRHSARSYYYFLRRPSTALAVVLILACLVFGRSLPGGTLILVLWALGYALALSPAYYTPRGSLLIELSLLPLAPLLLHLLLGSRSSLVCTFILTVLLLLFQWRAGRFARAMYYETLHFARISRQFHRKLEQLGPEPDWIVVSDSRVIWLPRGKDPNPWCLPYPRTEQFWLEDPVISPRQVPEAPIVPVDKLVANATGASLILMSSSPPRDVDLRRVLSSGVWTVLGRLGDQFLLIPRPNKAYADSKTDRIPIRNQPYQ